MAARISEEKLCALMLGEVTDTERRALEAICEKDPASREALEELRSAAASVGTAFGRAGADFPGLSDDQRRKVLETAGIGTAPAAADQGLDIDVEVDDPVRAADHSDLFSLGNLQTLTRSDPAPAPAGGGSDESSGLVDLRSLVQSQESGDQQEISELLNLGTGGSAGLAPVVAPETIERRRNWLVGIGLGLAAIVIIGGLIAIIVRHAGRDVDQGGEGDEAIAMLMAEIEKLKNSGGSADDLRKAEEALAEEQARKEALDAEQAEQVAVAKQAAAKDRKPSTGGASRPAAAAAGPAPAASPPRPKSGGVAELDDLLGGSAAKPAKKPAAASGGAVPDKLSRDQVQAGMSSVAGAVKNCGKGAGGAITVRATISPAGKVTSAKTQGAHAGTAVGSCAEKAVRRASFPRAKNKLDVSYPFKL